MKPGDRPMSLSMKLIFLFVVANAYAGAISLIFFPGDTESLFFWKIAPPINAVLFGMLYLIAGSVVLQAVIRGRWEPARYLTPMVIPFSLLLLLATLLHLDKFTPGFKLYYWLVVYIVAPAATIFFFWHYEHSSPKWSGQNNQVQPFIRWFAVGLGGLLAVYVLVSFISPEFVVNFWPWLLTPLLAKAFAAWLAALGGGLLWFAWEPDWKRLQPVSYLMALIPVATLVVLIFNRDQLKAVDLNMYVFVVALVGLGICGAIVTVVQAMSKR